MNVLKQYQSISTCPVTHIQQLLTEAAEVLSYEYTYETENY